MPRVALLAEERREAKLRGIRRGYPAITRLQFAHLQMRERKGFARPHAWPALEDSTRCPAECPATRPWPSRSQERFPPLPVLQCGVASGTMEPAAAPAAEQARSDSHGAPAAAADGPFTPWGPRWRMRWRQQQHGIVRFNCADSLDRTNAATCFAMLPVRRQLGSCWGCLRCDMCVVWGWWEGTSSAAQQTKGSVPGPVQLAAGPAHLQFTPHCIASPTSTPLSLPPSNKAAHSLPAPLNPRPLLPATPQPPAPPFSACRRCRRGSAC